MLPIAANPTYVAGLPDDGTTRPVNGDIEMRSLAGMATFSAIRLTIRRIGRRNVDVYAVGPFRGFRARQVNFLYYCVPSFAAILHIEPDGARALLMSTFTPQGPRE